MLTQLLNRFFGQQDPDKVIKTRLKEHWQDWLAPISADDPTGEDLTYHDAFQEIKEEVAKLSGIDYSLIMTESESILKNSSKDIRVVTYYCLAKLNSEGADGFADGLEVLAGLLDSYGQDLFPSRQNIRKNAIEWLANAKFTEQLNALQPIAESSLSRIIAALNLIQNCCKKLFLSDDKTHVAAPDLDALIRFFANSLKQQVNKTETKTRPTEPNYAASSAEPQSAPTVSEVIHSQRDLLEQARKMALYLREKPEGYLAAGRFLRALRWDTVSSLPPSDNRGKTRLPAPRNELRQHVNRLILQQQWQALFERVEGAFMEGANHFWLDLQRAAVMALQKMGEPYQTWADLYLTDIALMLERLKGIETLSFDNQTPFADDDTLHWLITNARIHRLDGETSLVPIAVSAENDWVEIEKQALDLANSETLEKAFLWLQHLPGLHSSKQRFLLQYTQARIAEQLGKFDVALKLFLGINEQQNLALLQWEPDLLFDVKSHLLKILKQKVQLKESNKTQLGDQIDMLYHQLVQLDPARALTLIG